MKNPGNAAALARSPNLVISLLVIGLLMGAPAFAQEKGAHEKSAQDQSVLEPDAWLARVNAALADMPDISGRFEQKQPNGAHAAGSYAMDWPDNLRFAYDHNGETVVTVKGKFVAVQEKPGGQPNWFPVSLTPLGVIRRAVADGIKPDMVVAFKDEGAAFSVTLQDPTGEIPGQATLYFSSANDQLYAWRLVDAQNLVTLVRLRDVTHHKALDKSAFAIVEYLENEDD